MKKNSKLIVAASLILAIGFSALYAYVRFDREADELTAKVESLLAQPGFCGANLRDHYAVSESNAELTRIESAVDGVIAVNAPNNSGGITIKSMVFIKENLPAGLDGSNAAIWLTFQSASSRWWHYENRRRISLQVSTDGQEKFLDCVVLPSNR